MRNYFLGEARRQRAEVEAIAEPGGPWHCHGGGAELSLDAGGEHFTVFRSPELAILLRGCATFAGATKRAGAEDVVQAVRAYYLHHGELPVRELEGAFTLALLDGRAGRLLLYRNLVGPGFTYYCETAGGLLFANNLADLVDARAQAPRPNADALPVYFIYRFVPGRETLFDGVYRLLPGELLTWDPRHGLRRTQRQTFADLRRPSRPRGDLAACVEDTLAGVVADYAAQRPETANLLSGGVDSSYLQMLWNRVSHPGQAPATFSISVNHAAGRGEDAYALSAARELGTRHTAAPADGPYAEYLLDTIDATAEPPNHAQTVYFGHLARTMVARGVTTGLCGEGADSQFGLALANTIHYARILKRVLPLRLLRTALARFMAGSRLGGHLWLAEHLEDWADVRHPVNQVAAFADWEAVRACFGAGGVMAATAYRRSLLTTCGASMNPLEAVHTAGLLGEGIDTAGLWTTLFNREGADLVCPFLDSRLIGLTFSLEPRRRYPLRHPKKLLKLGLARHGLRELAYRPKRGFGQPVFEWLAPGGPLRPLVERLAAYPFVDGATLARVKVRPTWFLYSLLCYDLWHKLFIDGTLPRRSRRRREAACGLA